MTGIIDIGGGLRGIYTSGIYDYLMDKGIDFDYCLGVSSGSANLVTYVAGQRGRTKRFYDEYSFEKEYFSVGNYFKKGMLIDLDYLYSGITNSTGKDPLDYEAIKNSPKKFTCVSTYVDTATPKYFTKDDLAQDDYSILKACCAIPVACRKPQVVKGERFFDGGLSDPIPYKKAFEDGVDKLVVCITLPIDYRKEPMPEFLVKILLCQYPKIRDQILNMHNMYNNGVEKLIELQEQGKILLVYPRECFGVNTITRDKEGMQKLYALGYEDGKKIEDYLLKDKKAEV